ncbi:killer cell lectin-like receptor subfamily G member 2 isoform X2 [Phalacrocorax carbo]|uniref:killer cell lectin-like receptor subfamily G member 2 isoform X2 n=1 Tax=Phalacrocorax carbo TaxID=9209 RepID=UPI003119FEEE
MPTVSPGEGGGGRAVPRPSQPAGSPARPTPPGASPQLPSHPVPSDSPGPALPPRGTAAAAPSSRFAVRHRHRPRRQHRRPGLRGRVPGQPPGQQRGGAQGQPPPHLVPEPRRGEKNPAAARLLHRRPGGRRRALSLSLRRSGAERSGGERARAAQGRRPGGAPGHRLWMASKDEQEAETTFLAQGPVVIIDPTNVKQDAKQKVAASSWVWRTWRHWKQRFWQSKFCCLGLSFGLVVVVIIGLVLKLEIPYGEKFHPEQCPSEWIGYRKKCYFISEEEKNWTYSWAFCAKNESFLAFFENQEEMSLAKHVKVDGSWIGLRRKGENFYWDNGVALKMDSFQIRNHSECAYLDAFTISTSACSLPRRWICVQLP